MRRIIFLMACVLAVLLAVLGACRPRALPPPPGGLTLQPGQYVRESYFAPDFNPEEVAYTFPRFTAAPGSDAQSEAFLKTLQEELVRAWQAQGLKVDQGKNVARLSGTIQGLSLKGARLRWLSGRLFASLTISGTITRGEQVLFAFQDQVDLSSPVSPGLAAPREKDLLLHQLARETARHILNELLLHGRTGSGERSAITRMMILGLCTTLVKSWIMPT